MKCVKVFCPAVCCMCFFCLAWFLYPGAEQPAFCLHHCSSSDWRWDCSSQSTICWQRAASVYLSVFRSACLSAYLSPRNTCGVEEVILFRISVANVHVWEMSSLWFGVNSHIILCLFVGQEWVCMSNESKFNFKFSTK